MNEKKLTQEQKRRIAMGNLVVEKLPYVKREKFDAIVERLANNEISEASLDVIDPNLVYIPEQTGKLDEGENGQYEFQVTDKLITDVLKKYNDAEDQFDPYKPHKYKLQHVLQADVKIFQKDKLRGVKYLGLLLEDGNKVRYVLTPKKEVKKQATENVQRRYKTTQVTDA